MYKFIFGPILRSVIFRKRWQIYHADPETGQLGKPVSVMNIIDSWDATDLAIPKRFLDYGVYMLVYTITMVGKYMSWKRSVKCTR